MFPKRATSFGRQACSVFHFYPRTLRAPVMSPPTSASGIFQHLWRGNRYSLVRGSYPKFEHYSFLRRLQGHSLAKAPPLSQTRARLAINYVESRKSHSVRGRKASVPENSPNGLAALNRFTPISRADGQRWQSRR